MLFIVEVFIVHTHKLHTFCYFFQPNNARSNSRALLKFSKVILTLLNILARYFESRLLFAITNFAGLEISQRKSFARKLANSEREPAFFHLLCVKMHPYLQFNRNLQSLASSKKKSLCLRRHHELKPFTQHQTALPSTHRLPYQVNECRLVVANKGQRPKNSSKTIISGPPSILCYI